MNAAMDEISLPQGYGGVAFAGAAPPFAVALLRHARGCFGWVDERLRGRPFGMREGVRGTLVGLGPSSPHWFVCPSLDGCFGGCVKRAIRSRRPCARGRVIADPLAKLIGGTRAWRWSRWVNAPIVVLAYACFGDTRYGPCIVPCSGGYLLGRQDIPLRTGIMTQR